jgi:thiamine biosynthesis protein ThiI
MHENSILIHYAELGLKGKNQPEFRRQLRQNLRKKLKSLGLSWTIVDTSGFFVIDVPAADRDVPFQPVLEKLREVFGVAWVTHARRLKHSRFKGEAESRDFRNLEDTVVAVAEAEFVPNKTFAVQVKRGDKQVPFTSPQIERRCGTTIRERTKWDKVNLSQPDTIFHVSVRGSYLYVYSGKTKAAGGLPVGTSGRLLTLLSGGIDSPVAAYLMARRGCRVDFIHFTATTMQQDEAREYKVFRLAQRLADFTMGSRIYFVPYTYFDLALLREEVKFEVILFRRFMMRVAAQLASRIRAKALVTGDNLSQVASQTLSNIVSTSRAVDIPILRPLIGFDKVEIVDMARQIGTYDISIEPYKDCCALIARNPKTISKHDKLTAIEQQVFPDYQKIIDQTLAEAICLQTDGKACAMDTAGA